MGVGGGLLEEARRRRVKQATKGPDEHGAKKKSMKGALNGNALVIELLNFLKNIIQNLSLIWSRPAYCTCTRYDNKTLTSTCMTPQNGSYHFLASE